MLPENEKEAESLSTNLTSSNKFLIVYKAIL